MMWLERRILVIWLALAAVCAGVVSITRLNPSPDSLEALGFDVCDGEPCFWGVKSRILKSGQNWRKEGAVPCWIDTAQGCAGVLQYRSWAVCEYEQSGYGRLLLYPKSPIYLNSGEGIEILINDMQFQSQLARYYFEKYVLEVAIATLEQGVAASKLDTYQFLTPVDAWGFPKYPSKTAILPPEVDLVDELKHFISANEPLLREPDCWLGTWINPRTQHFYLDITTSRNDLNEAKRIALEISDRKGRRIVALYNSKRNETIYL